MVAGEGGVGKTTLLLKYVNGSFVETTGMTIGIQFHTKNVKLDGVDYTLSLWDLGGQDRFRFMLPSYTTGAKGAILLYDMTRMDTLDKLEEWVNICRTYNKTMPILFCGTKADLEADRSVKPEYAASYMQTLNLFDHLELSAKTGQNVEKAFELLVRKILEQAPAPKKSLPGQAPAPDKGVPAQAPVPNAGMPEQAPAPTPSVLEQAPAPIIAAPAQPPAPTPSVPVQAPAPIIAAPAQPPAPTPSVPVQAPAPIIEAPAQPPAPTPSVPVQAPAPIMAAPAQPPAPTPSVPVQAPAPIIEAPAQPPALTPSVPEQLPAPTTGASTQELESKKVLPEKKPIPNNDLP